jgi:hypothetical protein
MVRKQDVIDNSVSILLCVLVLNINITSLQLVKLPYNPTISTMTTDSSRAAKPCPVTRQWL